MSRFVQPSNVTLTLENGDQLIVRAQLNAGQARARWTRMYRVKEDGSHHVDLMAVSTATVVAFLVDWHLKDDDMPIAGLSPDDLADVLDHMKPEDFKEIATAIDAHEAAILARRAAQKKTIPTGETASSPTLPSLVGAGGVTSG
jgi:lambda repressor-like predicted transcriptional regulator